MTAPPVRSGWEAELALRYAPRGEKTRLVETQRKGPLSVQRAFYPEGALCHSYLLHPPGGVVGGDTLKVQIQVGSDARALLTTPGATKFYRSLGPKARLTQSLRVASGASLEWMPQENIFFSETQTDLRTQIDLAEGAGFIGWEINCFGRPANAERFTAGRVHTQFELYRCGKPILLDRFVTEGLSMIDAPVGLRGFSAQAMLVATLECQTTLEQIQLYCAQDQTDRVMAATMMDGILVVRALAHQARAILAGFTEIWSWVRPVALDRIVCPPRIWAT